MGGDGIGGYLLGLMVFFVLGISYCDGYVFYVGGKSHGWIKEPLESYNHWAERNRFQINDKLVFTYKKGDDSALHVTKEDYDTCNISSPLRYMGSGNSFFLLDKSGPFYFISGVEDHCLLGQKMIVTVMAERPKSTPPRKSPISGPSLSPQQIEAQSPIERGQDAPSPSPFQNGGAMMTRYCTNLGGTLLLASVMLLGISTSF